MTGLSFCDNDGFGISKSGFTSCVNQTVFTFIPFLFLVIVTPKRVRYLNSLRIHNNVFDNPLQILKTSLTLIQALLTIAVVADVYRNYNVYNTKTKSLQSISFLVGSSIKFLSWLLSYYILSKEIRRQNSQNMFGLKGFWRLNLVCNFVTSVSYIPKYESISHEENNYSQLILCCSEFAISLVFGIFSIISCSGNNNPALDALNLSLQQNESKFSRLEVDDHTSYFAFKNESTNIVNRSISDEVEDPNNSLLDISIDETTRRERRPSSFDIIDNEEDNISADIKRKSIKINAKKRGSAEEQLWDKFKNEF